MLKKLNSEIKRENAYKWKRGKKDKSKSKWHNCGNLFHFARECTNSKKVQIFPKYSSIAFLAAMFDGLFFFWFDVDTGAITQVASDHVGFMDYRWIQVESQLVPQK